ncbi:MAG: ComF family protein [Victivallales bacterium]|nr:ComF family protein [Victivallales bacterium]
MKTGRLIPAIAKVLNCGAEAVCPFPCLACGVKLGYGKNLFCPECLNELKLICKPRCPGCGGAADGVLEFCSKCMEFERRPWDGAFALFDLRGAGQQLVYAFKFYNRPEMARPFAAMACGLLREEAGDIEFDLIIPVPLHWSRSLNRGYNQAQLFSEELSRLSGIPCRKLLRRIRRTPQQARLDREQRRKNLLGAFALKKGEDLTGKTLLLTDDVFTTGSTLCASVAAFRDSGVKAIYTLVIGRR